MIRLKKILLTVVVVLIVIQFIRPSRNNGDAEGANVISKKYQVPENVQSILKQSCYDCHSNSTKYPWYANVQPVGWWIQYSHVDDGKRHLNFSEYASYSEKKAKHKFEEIADEVRDGEMPLGTYTFLHHDAVLTEEQTKILVDWAESLK
ncbi:MAG: heme-binding domain-containing protein [Bacteroidetes bacterium]|nr:heme-binding domain-containing protein [Bacteroidota bacterium]